MIPDNGDKGREADQMEKTGTSSPHAGNPLCICTDKEAAKRRDTCEPCVREAVR